MHGVEPESLCNTGHSATDHQLFQGCRLWDVDPPEVVEVILQLVDESLTSLAVYFRNWHMFREYMNNIPC